MSSAQVQEHDAKAALAADPPHGHAWDSPEEVAHAKEHIKDNNKFFFVFFCLIVCAVFTYEFWGTSNVYLIFFWAATRVALIAAFFAYLFRQFSFILRTFIFSIFFLMGMIFLSMWDSTLPIFGDPISRGAVTAEHLFQPKPVTPSPPPVVPEPSRP